MLQPATEMTPPEAMCEKVEVEDGRGSLGHAATLGFPSPLVEPDVRISRIRLAADAHDCIMVRSRWTYRIEGCGAMIRARWQVPSDHFRCPASARLQSPPGS